MASTRPAPTISDERREQLALELERLGRGLDDELAGGEVLERVRRASSARARRRGLLGAPAPALGAAVEVLRDAARRRARAPRAPGRAAASARPTARRAARSPMPIVPAPTTPMTFGARADIAPDASAGRCSSNFHFSGELFPALRSFDYRDACAHPRAGGAGAPALVSRRGGLMRRLALLVALAATGSLVLAATGSAAVNICVPSTAG